MVEYMCRDQRVQKRSYMAHRRWIPSEYMGGQLGYFESKFKGENTREGLMLNKVSNLLNLEMSTVTPTMRL